MAREETRMDMLARMGSSEESGASQELEEILEMSYPTPSFYG